MHESDMFNNQESLEFQIALMQAENKELEDQIQNLKIKKELDQKLYSIISKYTQQPVNENTLDTIKLPRKIWGMILDEIADKTENLIKPSHQMLEYSLIRKQPELEKYIPSRPSSLASTLDLLNDKSISRATEIMKEYNSTNTKRAYISDIIYIQAWLSAVGFCFTRELSIKEITSFIMQHVEGLEPDIDQKLVAQGYKEKLGPHKLATVKRRLISLSIFLERVGWNNPVQSKDIKKLLMRLTVKYGDSKPRGKAITRDILDDMLDACGKNLIDIRDKALLLFGWASGGRRRSEIVQADMKDLVEDSLGEFVYTIPRSKTDQEGKGHPVPVKGRAAKALKNWLKMSGVTEGAIFRAVLKGGKVAGPLNDNAVYRIVIKRLKEAEYNEKDFCAHSLRSGFVTEAGRRNKPLGDVMAMTTHRNVNTVMKYYQAGSIINNSASNLAD